MRVQGVGRSKERYNGVYAMTAPCRNCTDRNIGCHGQCEKYAAYRAIMDKEKVRRQYESNANQATTIAIGRVTRYKWNTRK